MSFVDVFPTEPVIADDARVAAGADGAAERGERGEGVVGDERRRGAARARVVEERLAAARRRRRGRPAEIAARVDLDAGDLVRVALELAERERPHLVERRAGSRARSQRAQRLARHLAVVERDRAIGELLPLLVRPCRRSGRRRRRAPSSIARAIAARAVGLDLDVADRRRRRSRR